MSEMYKNGDVVVLKRYINITTKEVELLLQFWNSPTEKNEKRFPRGVVYKEMQTMLNCGAYIQKASDFTAYIAAQESEVETEYIHSNLGWCGDENESFYSYYSLPEKSTYSGGIDLKPKGSYEEWKHCVEQYAMTQVPLQLGIVLGLSAVMVGFLKDKLDGSIFCHIVGLSSRGKTTFASLSVSTSGNPSTSGNNTLMCSWEDTENYLLNFLSGNRGIPVVFDEISKADGKDLSKFCYSVANNRSKGRMNANGTCRETTSWATTVISTGESSLLAQCNNNEGLLARILEIEFDTITESAKQADNLKSGITQNYGFANQLFAKYIMANKEMAYKLYDNFVEVIPKAISVKNDLVNRLCKRIAVIMTTAKLASKALGLEFDLNGILGILVGAVEKQNQLKPFDTVKAVVELIRQDIAIYPNRYPKQNDSNQSNYYANNKMAVIKDIKQIELNNGEVCRKEINFITSQFEDLLNKNKFNNVSKVLNALKEQGYLYHDKGRNTVKRKIDGNAEYVYCIRLPELEELE